MTPNKRAMLVVLGVALVALACHSPTHTGGGAIKAIALRPDLKPIGLFVSPGEEYLVVQTAAPANLNIVYLPNLKEQSRIVLLDAHDHHNRKQISQVANYRIEHLAFHTVDRCQHLPARRRKGQECRRDCQGHTGH